MSQDGSDLSSELNAFYTTFQQWLAASRRGDVLAAGLVARVRRILALLNPHGITAQTYTLGSPSVEATTPYEARYLEIRFNPDASSIVRIDKETPFHLSRGLTAFLVRLVSGRADDDGLLGYKSRAELLKWLRHYTRRQVNAVYVNHRVCALRKCLRNAGIKRHLVHTDAHLGVRFALRCGRSPGPEAAHDVQPTE